MTTIPQSIVRLICYCGLSKDEYQTIKRDAYINNFAVWKILNALMILVYAIMAFVSVAFNGYNISSVIQIVMTGYFAIVNFLFFFVLKEDSLPAQFVIYLSMIMMFVSALLVNVYQPSEIAVTFVILLVMLPMVMVDKPYFMAIVLISSVAVYLFSIHGVKSGEKFALDALNTISYGFFGIVINCFYNYIRIKDLMLQKKEREHSENLKTANTETEKLNVALKQMSESVIELLGDVVESRDHESGEHINRVRGFSYILATQVMEDLPEYNLDKYTVELIAFTSALHDVGKISISDSILLKPGKLSPEEFEEMKTHCIKGSAVVNKMRGKWGKDYLEMGISICENHHEKWDGKGYPNGLKGDEIPIAAQIVSIADIYDALTTKRVYKDAFSYDEAFQMIIGGECGAFSEKLLSCFKKCKDKFEAHANHVCEPQYSEHEYELVSNSNPNESFVIGLHDRDKTLREKVRLDEELAVLESLTERFAYVCYVNIHTNQVIRFKADASFAGILDSYGDELKSNEKFDRLLNSIIVSEDYDDFRNATERNSSMKVLQEKGHISTNFRIRLDDGVHYCKMRISCAPNNPDAVIIGISMRDEEHRKEAEYIKMQQELAIARKEMENREKLADRLAVIDSVSSEYDYVCSLNADTMDVVVYRAEAWIRDMFKNLEDIVVSPEARNQTLKGIIYPDDFERFQVQSRHENVLRGLAANGTYSVDYRAYKYGKLVNYQTKYTLDKHNPKRIIIGLRCINTP